MFVKYTLKTYYTITFEGLSSNVIVLGKITEIILTFYLPIPCQVE